jgi:hypothetical protein
VLRQQLLRDRDQPQPARFGGADQRIPEQNPLGLVHAKVHCEDLLDAPIGHRIADKYRAGCNCISALSLSRHRRSHLPNRDPARGFDAALNHISGRTRRQLLCSVIRLLCPLILNELDPAPRAP